MGRNWQELVGKQFGDWTILSVFRGKRSRLFCVARCKCGVEKTVRLDGVLAGQSTGCGCRRLENASKAALKHGFAHTRIYGILQGMKGRCFNKKDRFYHRYGERGITVCEEWRKNPKAFIDWALANGYKDNLTIDRIDVNGNYEPSNCRWITRQEQLKNTSRNVYITYKGETLCAQEWCDRFGLRNNVVIKRYRVGLPLELVFQKGKIEPKLWKLYTKEK